MSDESGVITTKDSLDQLIKIQMDRVTDLAKRESDTGKKGAYSNLAREISELRQLLRDRKAYDDPLPPQGSNTPEPPQELVTAFADFLLGRIISATNPTDDSSKR